MKFKFELHTNGKGLWTQRKAVVKVYSMELAYTDEHAQYSEVKVFFNKSIWNIDKHGLIYTDPLFLKELKAAMRKLCLPTDLYYSEQGMQGDNFVSLDGGPKITRVMVDRPFR